MKIDTPNILYIIATQIFLVKNVKNLWKIFIRSFSVNDTRREIYLIDRVDTVGMKFRLVLACNLEETFEHR